jgi:LPXTG-motif cell wall-anchored protein
MRQPNHFGFTLSLALLFLVTAIQFTSSSVSADANETAAGSANASQQASISAGGGHTCVVITTGAVKCWGDNWNGQLGDNTTIDKPIPTDVTGLTNEVTAITTGQAHTCALLTTGAVKCWGDNHFKQLGDNTTTNKPIPTDVTGLTTGVTAIAAGWAHTCALLTTGAVKCWGENDYGQLGDNTTIDKLIPTDVTGLTNGVTAITAGYDHTCALLTTGAVKCWGGNYFGQLGDNTTIDKLIPTDVTGLTNGVTAITAGAWHTCALLTSAVKCWGSNGVGQLGDNTTIDKLIPTDVTGLTNGVTAITTTAHHTCALLTTGAVKCWGDNDFGQVGNNTATDYINVPTDVTGLTNGVTAITAGRTHTCALLASGAVKCWGENNFGQLGDNTTIDKLISTDVAGIPGAPTITTVTAGNGSLSIAFTPGNNGVPAVTNYMYSTDGANYTALSPASVTSTFTINGLTNGTTYSVTIKAVNAIGDSLASNAMNGTPTAPAAAPVESSPATSSPSATAAEAPSATSNKSLPDTGGEFETLLFFAALLIAGGLVVASRRRLAQD